MGKVKEETERTGQQEINELRKGPDYSDDYPDRNSQALRFQRPSDKS